MLPRQQLSGWRPCFSDMTLTLATFSIYIQCTVIPGKHVHQLKEVSTVATGLALIMTSEWLSLTRDIGPSNHACHVHLCDGVLLDFFKSSIRLSYAVNCPRCSVFILLLKKEKPTTKSVDWISSGRVFQKKWTFRLFFFFQKGTWLGQEAKGRCYSTTLGLPVQAAVLTPL